MSAARLRMRPRAVGLTLAGALLGMLLGAQHADGYDMVRDTWKTTLRQDGDAFDRTWRRALHDGVVPNTAGRKVTPSIRAPRLADEVRNGLNAAHHDGLELVIQPHPYLRDADVRFAGSAQKFFAILYQVI